LDLEEIDLDKEFENRKNEGSGTGREVMFRSRDFELLYKSKPNLISKLDISVEKLIVVLIKCFKCLYN